MFQSTWLVVGASGFLGSYICNALRARGYRTIAHVYSRGVVGNQAAVKADLTVAGSGARLIEETKPAIVVNCAALANVDLCDREPELARRLNADLCGELAEGCNATGATLVAISTDQLWRNSRQFVTEDEALDPIGVYSQTKADGEAQARRANHHVIVRTNFFGRAPAWKPSLFDLVLTRLKAGETFNGFSDVYFTPIAVTLVSEWLLDIVEAGLAGTFHLGGSDRVSKYDFAIALAKAAGLETVNVKSGLVARAGLAAARPNEMSMSSAKLEKMLGRSVPNLDQSIRSALTKAL